MKTNLPKFIFILIIISLFKLSAFGQTVTDTYTSSGTWVCPAGVTSVTVECWGAGGAGGGETTNGSGIGGGGGGGAYASSVITVIPGNSYSVVVGTGGTTGTGNGGNGGNSSFNGTSVVAAGGSGGTANTGVGGAGGSVAASIGTIRYAGGNGGNGSGTTSGGGGGGAGSTGAGGNASGSTGGSGTSLSGGNGGNGVSTSSNGNVGSNYGGGGSGASCGGTSDNRNGGAGANGLVKITYNVNEITIGTGASTLTYPYHGLYHDARSQFIITASELSAEGLYGGCSLTSLAFNVSSKASTQPYTSFTIKIGHTTSSTFSSATWLTPTFTTCYTGNYTTAVGWNVHTFTTNFTWNGTDNIVVETCFDNTSYTSNDPVYCTTTTGNTVCYADMDAAAGCSLTAEGTSTSRPNMKFRFNHGVACSGTPTGGTASASPSTMCAGSTSTLSVTGSTIGGGITYQWQSSPDNSTWSNIIGATSATYNASPSVSTYYRRVITCTNSGLSANSTSVLLTINSPLPVIVSGGGTFCGSATLTATGGDGGTIFWQNTTSGGTSVTTPSTSQVVTSSGTYYFRASNGTCWSTEGSATVTILNAPTISSVTATPTNICNGGSSQLQVNAFSSNPLSSWTFTAVSGSFTPISGGTPVSTSVSAADFLGDTKTSISIPIGFTFYYLGTGYTNIIAMSDGYISFNPSATSSLTNNLANSAATQRPLLAPLWDDLDGASGTGSASYVTTGSAGSRVFTIEWLNWQWNYAATGATISFQIKLYEATGVIEFIYRQESGAVNSGSASIGITDIGTGSGNFISLNGTGASPTASTTVETTTLNTKPATGQIYRFTPPPLSYTWSPSTFLSSTTIPNPIANAVTASTTYTVSVSNGTCATTSTTAVIVAPLSCNAITTNNSPCVGSHIITANPQNGGTPYSYSWKQDGSAFGGNTQSVNPTLGTHTYTVTVTDACASTCSATITVTTYANPTITTQPTNATVLAGNTTTFTIAASGTNTYQWQYATAVGGPWSNVNNGTPTGVTYANPNSTTLSVIVAGNTSAGSSHYYRCVVTNTDGCSTNSNSAQLTINQYCNSSATSTLDMDIHNVTFGTINNTTGNVSLVGTQGTATGTAGMYSNFRGSSVPVPNITQGSTVPLSVTIGGTAYSHRVDAYFDFNRDGDFADAGEAVAVFAYANPTLPNTTTVNINVPAGASIGQTVMRIVCVEASASTNGCGTYTWGETEDYDIYIISSTPCSGTPTGGLASSSISTFCNSGLPILTATGYTRATGITLQWQSSADGISWNNISGAITDYYAVSPAINQTTYYRMEVKCSGNVAYTNVVQVTNLAQSITSTNSPQYVTCNTAANLTATATGGTITWYANETGGTALATGSTYSPTVTANTTYYVTTGVGGSSGNVGKTSSPLSDGYYGGTGTGLVFDAISAFTLVSVKVYVQTAGSTVSIILQDNGGNTLNTATFTSCPVGLQTLTLNFSVPVGTGYKLLSNNSTSLARDFSGTSFPYTLAGVCSITSGWLSGTSSTYYFFYDWVVSSGCESSPRVPVYVYVSGGVTSPVCSSNPIPSTGATGVCPISTTISWSPSNTACRAATGYKLYFGTDAAATNIHNGTDIGFVTSYEFPTLSPLTTYYWRIVPYNTAGDATCSTIWNFTTQSDPGNVCVAGMGTGVINVPALPYNSGSGTTAGSVNDLTSSNTVACGSTSYLTGEDQVFIFTPTTTGTITITLTSTGTYTGLMLYDDCPLSATACGATPGTCVASAYSSTGNKTMNACVTAGVKYYLVLDSYASPTNNPYSNLYISAPSGTGAPANDLPCNASTLILGAAVTGDNSCAGYANEPAKPSCWTTGNLNTVWYKVVAPASGQLSVRTTTGTLTDTQIGLYSGNCNGLIAVSAGCNNDITGCGTSLSSSFTVTGLTAGNTYYIAVDGAYDLQGTFTIQAIDPATQTFPLTPGQDCAATLSTCNTVVDVPDPGYANVGNICDFTGVGNCTGGERASVWYTINIKSSGFLQFDIIPTDYSGGTPGAETDYDFLVWKTGGSGTITSCAGIASNSATGLVACNYSYLGVTGCNGTAGDSPIDPGFNDAYEPRIPVAAGDQYLICVSNYTMSTAGFVLDYASYGGDAIINTAATPTNLQWTGSTSTAYTVSGNWGGCTKPTCTINAFLVAGAPNWPVISSDEAVQNLSLNASTTLTINSGKKLTVCGNLSNSGTINVDGTLEVKGHFTNSGTINFGAGSTLIFSGSTAQSYTSNTALTIPNLTINNTSGGVTFSGNTHVTIPSGGLLTLTNGIVYTNANSMIIMAQGSSSTNGTATSYIDGPMRKEGNTAYVFPLGNGGRLAQIGISAPSSVSTFQAQYFATIPANYETLDLTQGTANLNHISTIEYWQLDRVAGTGSAYVTLYWSNASLSQIWLCGSYADLSVAKWDGTKWTNLNVSGGTITGSCSGSSSGTITTQSALSTFSPFTFGSLHTRTLNPLPIQLLSFEGKNRGKVNLLTWQTATETNNDYFIIEKSPNGEVYEQLTMVKGAGNSNIEMDYSFVDQNPYSNITYYRLKQVDFDGKISCSKIISVLTNNFAEVSDVQFAPNPFNNEVNVKLVNMNSRKGVISVIDLLGNKVMEKNIEVKDLTLDHVVIDLSELPNGMYFLMYKADDFTKFERMIKQ